MNHQTVNINNLGKDQLASYSEVEKYFGRGRETRKVPVDKIAIRVGFQKRINFGDIKILADGILASGGTEAIEVDVLKDGTPVLINGERRLRAYRLLVELGHPQFSVIEAFVSSRAIDDVERKVKHIRANNGKHFESLELAEAFKDLKETDGLSAAEIARRTGYTPMSVSNLLRLAGVTDEEKELIQSNAVSATAVVDMVKQNMDAPTRVGKIRGAAASGGTGGSKLKIGDVKGMKEPEPPMNDIEAPKLPIGSTIDDYFRETFTYIRALEKLIGTDSKMSDLSFKIDQRVREIKKIVKEKYTLIDDAPF